MDSIEYLDSLVREYLLFRGFLNTLRAFDLDLRNDQLTQLNADRLTHALLTAAHQLNYTTLQDTWSALNHHVFPSTFAIDKSIIKTMETNLFRYFIVLATQQGKTDKVTEFIHSIDLATCGQDWMVWSSLPYIKKPATTPPFDVYFTKAWHDKFTTSLRNFLERALTNMPLPRLLNFNMERIQRKSLLLENSKLLDSVDYWRSLANASKSHTLPHQFSTDSVHTNPIPGSTNILSAESSTTKSPNSFPHALDDEPYMILDETTVQLPHSTSLLQAPPTRLSISPDARWVALDASDLSSAHVRVWSLAKLNNHQVLGTPVTQQLGPAPLAELIWIDHVRLLILYSSSARLVQIDSTKVAVLSELSFPYSNLSSAVLLNPHLVIVAGTQGLVVISINPNSSFGLTLVSHQPLPQLHAPTDSVQHTTIVHGHRPGAHSTVALVTASWVHIYDISNDLITLKRTIAVPLVAQCSFAYPVPSAMTALTLISSTGTLMVLNCESGVFDPLQEHQLPDFEAITHGRGFALDHRKVGRGDGGFGAFLVAGTLVYCIPGGELVQSFGRFIAPSAKSVHALSENHHHTSTSSLLGTGQSMAISALALTGTSSFSATTHESEAAGSDDANAVPSLYALPIGPLPTTDIAPGVPYQQSVVRNVSLDRPVCVAISGNVIVMAMPRHLRVLKVMDI